MEVTCHEFPTVKKAVQRIRGGVLVFAVSLLDGPKFQMIRIQTQLANDDSNSFL
jgi:hypothetical protein